MKRLSGKRGEFLFESQNVLYLLGDINYSYSHLSSGEIILSCRTLKWFADQWPTFLRVHKNALVNPLYIQCLQVAHDSKATTYVIMQDKARLAIARRRVEAVVEQGIQLGLLLT